MTALLAPEARRGTGVTRRRGAMLGARFAGAGGGGEDDFVAGEELADGFFLVVVGLGVGVCQIIEEDVEDVVRSGVFGEILVAERSGLAGRMGDEKFSGKAQRARRAIQLQADVTSEII